MKRSVFKVGFVIIAVALIAFVVAAYFVQSGPNWIGRSGDGLPGPDSVLDNRTNAVLNAVRLKPQGAEDDPVTADPLGQVDFVYRIENRGDAAVEGLSVDPPSCCAQVVRGLPARLPAGGTTEFGFRMRSPLAGTLEKRISIFTGAQTAVELRVAVRANAKVPRLLEVPANVRLSAIRGDSLETIVQIHTVELLGGRPFVTGLEVQGELAEVLSVGPPEQTQQQSPENFAAPLCYSFKLSADESQSLPRTAGGYIKVRTSSVDGQDDRLIPLYVAVLDTVTVVPEQVVFDRASPLSSKTKRVIVINRRPEQGGVIRVDDFDATLLDVRPIGAAAGNLASFDVGPAGDLGTITASESRVVFKVGRNRVSLTVRFAGVASSEGPAP